jgi:ferredoxin
MAAPERSRTFSILNRLGLTRRIIGKGDTAPLDEAIDWVEADAKLREARKASLEYLCAALRDEPYCEASTPVENAGRAVVLADHGNCTGCTACANICPKDAISMERDREGFSYPAVDMEQCVHCGRCTAALYKFKSLFP